MTNTQNELSRGRKFDVEKSASRYVVLHSEGTTWRKVKELEARSAEAAIQDVVEDGPTDASGDGAGTYVAVPARSWRPIRVRIKTKREIRLSPVSEPKGGAEE